MVDSMLVDLSDVATEQKDPRAADIENLPLSDQCAAVLNGMVQATHRVKANKASILNAVEQMRKHWKEIPVPKRQLYIAGAGTSGRLAAITAFNFKESHSFHIDFDLAGGRDAFYTAVEGAEDKAEATRTFESTDGVIALSASGRTPYALASLEAAKKAGALTIAIHNNPGSPLSQIADIDICNATGPECPRGSTRMKAGTSQYTTLQVLMHLLSEGGGGFDAWFQNLEEAIEAIDRNALTQRAQELCTHFKNPAHQEGRLVYAGDGVCGLLGVVDGAELQPTYSWGRVAYQVPALAILLEKERPPIIVSPRDFVINLERQSDHAVVLNMLLKTLTTVFAFQSGWIVEGEMINLDPNNMTKKLVARRVQILKNLHIAETDAQALEILKRTGNDLSEIVASAT